MGKFKASLKGTFEMKLTIVCLLTVVTVSSAFGRGRAVEKRIEPRVSPRAVERTVYRDAQRRVDMDSVVVEITNCVKACPTANILGDLVVAPGKAQLGAQEVALVNRLAVRSAEYVRAKMDPEAAVKLALTDNGIDPEAFTGVCRL